MSPSRYRFQPVVSTETGSQALATHASSLEGTLTSGVPACPLLQAATQHTVAINPSALRHPVAIVKA